VFVNIYPESVQSIPFETMARGYCVTVPRPLDLLSKGDTLPSAGYIGGRTPFRLT